ncbi:50S ribosomal protein L6 [Candidatus Woesearchaeota archaeon]|nr:50S ribosomal protein L6 [Candidatus Woesearchaeota archaeon]
MDVEIPDGVTVDIAPDHVITIKGKKGEVKRTFHAIGITVAREGNTVVFSAKNATKKEKTMIGTFRAHLKNMVTGVVNGHQYKMKICSGHFPMTVAVKGNELTIKNFLGEKVPRIARLLDGVSVKVEGSDVSIDSPDLEKAGIVASRIELATFISRRDRRVFQDGIFITSKPGVEKI